MLQCSELVLSECLCTTVCEKPDPGLASHKVLALVTCVPDPRCVQSASADTCKGDLPSASVAPVHTRGGSGRGLFERSPCRTHTMADRQHAPSGVATVMDTLSSSTHHHPPWRQLSMPRVDRVDHVWRSLRISCRATPLGGGVARHRCMSAVTTVPTRAGRCASCVSLVRPCAAGLCSGLRVHEPQYT